MAMQKQSLRRRLAGLSLLACSSCGLIPGLGGRVPTSALTDSARRAANGDVNGALKVASDRVAPGVLGGDAAALVQAIGPVAIIAVNQIAAAIEQYQAEKREQQEQQRLKVAAAQLFYAGQCTQPTPAGEAAGSAASDPDALEKKAAALYAKGDYAGAQPLLKQAYDARKQKLGPAHPETARTLNKLAVVEFSLENYAVAMADAEVALDARKKLADPQNPKNNDKSKNEVAASLDVAESLGTTALIDRGAGLYQEARGPLKQSLEIRTKLLGAQHVCVAQSEAGLGELNQLMGAYRDALPLYQDVVAIRDKQLGAAHRDAAEARNDLGSLYQSMGLYGPAEKFYREALDARAKLGADHPDVADSDNDLAGLYHVLGNYAGAEELYQRAIEIRKKRFGQGLELAESYNALAGLYMSEADYRRSESLYKQALELRKSKLKPDHPLIAQSLNDLAGLYLVQRDYGQAENLYLQALDARKKKLGPDHPVVAQSLNALAMLYKAKGDLPRAEQYYAQARDIRIKKFGSDNPDSAESLFRLGVLYHQMGDYKRAEPLYREALAIRERKLGAGHPDVADSLTELASLLVSTGRGVEAVADLRRALAISEQLLRNVGAVASEARLSAFLQHLRAQEEIIYSLLLDKSVAAGDAQALALSVALLRKGRSVDEVAATSRAIYQGLGAADRQRFEQLRALRGELAHLKLAGVGEDTAAQVKKLAEQADELEQQLSQQSAPLRARSSLPSPDDVIARIAKALPAGGALIEVLAFHPVAFHAAGAASDDLHYYALVLTKEGQVRGADLGAGKVIDGAVKGFLKAITDPMNAKGKQKDAEIAAAIPKTIKSAQELDHLLLAPIRGFLDKRSSLFLSLDGQLNLLPFAALHDGKDFLVNRYELTYLTSGRDLLRGSDDVHPSSNVALLAHPEFVKGAKGRAQAATRGFETVSDSTASRFDTQQVRLPGIPPLEGTAEEARAIHRLLPHARLLLGKEGTKDAFLGLQAPGILHVATHGWFRTEKSTGGGGRRGLEIVADLGVAASSALLNSMLLLAGAGVPSSDGKVVLQPSGLATALEVAGMNLWGTQLVVLSACETGRGDVTNLGQGVYGLRRAVMVAGAETLVTSLWQVDDEATRDLMTRYYRALLDGKGRVAAMREAEQAILKEKGFIGYWAPFIAIGRSGPLVGIGKKTS
jgi:CHAT domain-containing protein/tetratricopeptide (TPR) repeat protein